MKKALALIMALVMMVPFASVAFAADTTLTATVPEAAYTLNIPADQTVEFGTAYTEIGIPTVSKASGFADGKNLQITITFDPFKSATTDTTIPFSLKFLKSNGSSSQYDYLHSGSKLRYEGLSSGGLSTSLYGNEPYNYDKCYIYISSRSWGRALAGDYTATITYTAEVVVEK